MSAESQPSLFTFSEYPAGIPKEVCDLFERLALEVAGMGWKRYSADALTHRIRWHMHIEQGNRDFKANNNWTADLARWFLARHPKLKEQRFFELRQTRSEAA